jgi:uncharacterized protein (TIGR00255 family)
MTGYGEARLQRDELSVAVELRALNNRYLKVSLRAAEPYYLLEPEIERALRQRVKRGTIQVHLTVHRQPRAGDYQLNHVAIRTYVDQLHRLQKELRLAGEVPFAHILALPGVVVEPDRLQVDPGSDWGLVEPVFREALERLQAMRAEEGRAMEQELLSLCSQIANELERIRVRAPLVVTQYRDKLHERVRGLLAELDVVMDRNDLIKEVSIFAERSDITEEVVRLTSHISQFHDICKEPESPGRKLEFLTQEMFREANTIGSKANDVDIARHVVEIKGAIEKIRELIQNVE